MKKLLALLFCFWSAQVWAANPLFVADGGDSYSATSPVSMAIPSGSIVNGQLMIMYICATDTDGTSTVTTPTGWTSYVSYVFPAGAGGFIDVCYVMWKIYASDGASVSVSSGTQGASYAGMDGNIRVYKNTRSSGPFNQVKQVGSASGTGTNQTLTIPAFTETYVSGEVYVTFYASLHNLDVCSGSSYNPTSGDTYCNFGHNNGISMSDYSPGSQPGTMVISLGTQSVANANDEHAIGLTILPQSTAITEGLPLVRAGS